MKLYELTNEYLNLLDWADDPDVEEQVFNDTLEGLTGEIEDKVENCGKVIREIESLIGGCDAEIKRLQARKKKLEGRKANIMEYVKNSMKVINKPSIVGKLFSFTVKATPEKTIIDDEASIPKEYLRVKTETAPDKDKIKAAIKAGEKIAWAHLEKGDTLIIK